MFIATGAMGGKSAVLTFLQASTPTSDNTISSYPFNGVNIGTATADRYVLAVFANVVVTTGRSLSSVTINGNTATLHRNLVSEVAASNDVVLTIAGLLVTSGTTADFVANYSSTMNTCFLSVYTLTKWRSTTPFGAGSAATNGTATSISTTLNIPARGALLVGGAENFSDTMTAGGFTSDNQTSVGSFAALKVGHENQLAAETGRSISVSVSPTARNMAIAGVSWQ